MRGKDDMEGGAGAAGRGAMGRWAGRWCSIVFVATLAWVALLFYGGDIGRWNDDYFFARQFHRDASFTSGDATAPMPVRSWLLDGPMHFWRPLYRDVWTPIVVSLWQVEDGRWLHVIAAGVHAAVCAGLWWFLRSLGAGRTAAGIAALCFLVYPADFEGAFWPPCTPTPAATGMMLGALWLQARWTRFVDGLRPLGPAVRSPALLAIAPAALAFAASCCNEQPGFIVLAMPLMVWCARGGSKSGGARWSVALAPAALSLAAVAAYALVARWMHPPHVSDRTGGVVAAGELSHRVSHWFGEIVSRHTLRHFGVGAWHEGRAALTERPGFAPAMVGLAVLVGMGWAWIGAKRSWALDALDLADSERPRARGPGLALLGIGVFVSAWGPLTLIHYPASPRLAYAPGIGLAIALAGAVEMITRRWRGRPLTHILLRVATVPVLIVFATMMVGVQHAYRARFLADQRQGEALRRLVPDPARAVDPVFIPVHVADLPVHTGAKSFDGYFAPPLASDWAAGWWLQVLYRREDVMCARGTRPGGGLDAAPKLRWVGVGQVKSATGLTQPGLARSRLFDLSQVIPFEIDAEGSVLLYTHYVIEPPQEGPSTPPTEPVVLPMAAGAFASGRAPKRVLVVPRVGSTTDGAEGRAFP